MPTASASPTDPTSPRPQAKVDGKGNLFFYPSQTARGSRVHGDQDRQTQNQKGRNRHLPLRTLGATCPGLLPHPPFMAHA